MSFLSGLTSLTGGGGLSFSSNPRADANNFGDIVIGGDDDFFKNNAGSSGISLNGGVSQNGLLIMGAVVFLGFVVIMKGRK